jgi:fumarate reductase subunit C
MIEFQKSSILYVFMTLLLLAISLLIFNFVASPETHQAVWDFVNQPLINKYNEITLEDGTLRTEALNRIWEDI